MNRLLSAGIVLACTCQLVDRIGQLIVRGPCVGWAYIAVAADPRDGFAWIVERRHSQVGGVDRLLRVDLKGKVVIKEITINNGVPFDVACHPTSGMAWVVLMRKGLLRVPVKDDPLPTLEIPARSVSIGVSGRVWVATETTILRLDRDRKPAVEFALDRPSSQTWLTAY